MCQQSRHNYMRVITDRGEKAEMVDNRGTVGPDGNELGQYVYSHRGRRSLNQIARDGGMSVSALHRLIKSPLTSLPPARSLQSLADGLGVDLVEIQQVAMRACGVEVPTNLSNREQAVIRFFRTFNDNDQAALFDIMRTSGEHLRKLRNEIAFRETT